MAGGGGFGTPSECCSLMTAAEEHIVDPVVPCTGRGGAGAFASSGGGFGHGGVNLNSGVKPEAANTMTDTVSCLIVSS